MTQEQARTCPILLVEDNDDDVLITKRAFARGHVANPLVVVRDGDEALDYVFRRGKYADAPRPGLILLDLNLPKVDGFSVLRTIKNDPEARSMATHLCTPTSRNLVRVFFLQERLKAAGRSVGEPAQHVHVVGAGVMGGDIAAWCALRGMGVTLQDLDMERIKPALDRAKSLFRKRLKSKPEVDNAVARLEARRGTRAGNC